MVVEAVSIGNDLLPEKDTTFSPYLHGGGSIQAEEEEAASPPLCSVRKRKGNTEDTLSPRIARGNVQKLTSIRREMIELPLDTRRLASMNGHVVRVVTTLFLSLYLSLSLLLAFFSFLFFSFPSLVIASWNVYSRDDFNKNGGKNSLKLTLVTDDGREGSRELFSSQCSI